MIVVFNTVFNAVLTYVLLFSVSTLRKINLSEKFFQIILFYVNDPPIHMVKLIKSLLFS